MRLIVKGGTLFTDSGISMMNMLVENGKIVGFPNSDLDWDADEVMDATDMYVFPGAVDAHAHISYPEGEEDFLSGTCAAAAGGFTTIVDMDHKSGCTTEKNYIEKIKFCQAKSIIDFGLCAGIVVEDSDLRDIGKLVNLGTPYVKLFMPLNPDYDFIYRAMTACKDAGTILGVHAEDMQLVRYFSQELEWGMPINFARSRPEIAEQMATAAILEMAAFSDSSVHFCHTSTASTAEIVVKAKERGIKASIEIQPHYLALDERSFIDKGAYVKTTPPLRNEKVKEILWQQLSQGKIDFVSSDHFYCSQKEKEAGFADIRRAPAGIPGLEYALELIYHFGVNSGKIDIKRFIELMAKEPAKFCGYYPRKGTLSIGSDADFVIFNPKVEWVIDPKNMFSKARYTPFADNRLKGKVMKTFLRGREVYDGHSIKVEKGFGKYIASIKK